VVLQQNPVINTAELAGQNSVSKSILRQPRLNGQCRIYVLNVVLQQNPAISTAELAGQNSVSKDALR